MKTRNKIKLYSLHEIKNEFGSAKRDLYERELQLKTFGDKIYKLSKD